MNIKTLAIGLGLWGSLLVFMFSIPFWSFSTEKEISLAFLDEIQHDKAVVFFGFTSCHDVCPVSMSALTHLANSPKFDNGVSKPAVFFVDIDLNSSRENAENYAKSFSDEFIGIHPDMQTLSLMKGQFGLNIQQRGDDIQHMGRTYILEKKSQKWILTKAVNPQALDKEWLEKALLI